MLSAEQIVAEQIRLQEAVDRDPAVRRAMARLKMTTDRRLGLETPAWIRDLAEGVRRDAGD